MDSKQEKSIDNNIHDASNNSYNSHGKNDFSEIKPRRMAALTGELKRRLCSE